MSILLAEYWTPDIDPTGMYVSQKIDGVRAYHDGEHLLTRNMHHIKAPKWYMDEIHHTFGGEHIDGELTLGAGKVHETSGLVRRQKNYLMQDRDWKRLAYMVFDLPESPGTFKERFAKLEKLVKENPSEHIHLIPYIVCPGRDSLEKMLDIVVDQGGEGLMLRHPESKYIRERSPTLLKVVKVYRAEARVVGYQDGTGSLKGKMGALLCEALPSSGPAPSKGVRFKVGTGFTHAQRGYGNCPEVGSIITYGFKKLNDSGKPREPRFVMVKR